MDTKFISEADVFGAGFAMSISEEWQPFRKKIENKTGIIKPTEGKMGDIAKEVFDNFSIDNITISEPTAEEVIAKIFQEKK